MILYSNHIFIFCIIFSDLIDQLIGFMPSCTTSWTSASSLFPVWHYWPNWLIQVRLIIVAMTTEVKHTW